ncbi:hypothetical protein B0A48_05258 [Cryoendolithus antarcticus]|uniref:Uncharacterized protein n=1 Tax=Cryoendolithus antarcticus TaxID=1507870 RepID=A0A1V8THY9_9PEZI|nr:hypothetical protein B0A48_05258 [Cryoendolithus antarcticus]
MALFNYTYSIKSQANMQGVLKLTRQAPSTQRVSLDGSTPLAAGGGMGITASPYSSTPSIYPPPAQPYSHNSESYSGDFATPQTYSPQPYEQLHPADNGYDSEYGIAGPSNAATGVGRRTRMTLGKGLKPVLFHANLDDMLAALSHEVEQNVREEALTIELFLHADASIPLLRPIIGPYSEGGEHDIPSDFKTNTNDDGDFTATVAAIASAPQPQVKQIQRAASRGICVAIESLDGFRYTFNNVWSAKDLDGLRFSYICQDSMQNKDRHANGFARTNKTPRNHRGARKATFDCRGSVNVKFSARSGGCIVQYRHRRVHCKVEERLAGGRAVPVGEYGEAALVIEGEVGPVAKRKRVEDAFAREYGPGTPAPPRLTQPRFSEGTTSLPSPPISGPPIPPPRVPSLFELLSETAAEDAEAKPLGSAAAPWWANT